MGRHAGEKRGRRGFAGWIIAAAVAALVVIIAAVGYIVVMVRSSGEAACKDTESLAIAAGPIAAPALQKAAAAYNATAPVVRSSCITAHVTAAADASAREGLSGTWSRDDGPAPGLWIPDNAASLAALDAAQPERAAGHPTDPLAWSPVVLAMRTQDAAAASSLTWSTIAASAQSGHAISLGADRTLAMALPPVRTAPATSFAAQALLATEGQTSPVDAATVRSHDAMLSALASDYRGTAKTTAVALTQLARPGDSASIRDTSGNGSGSGDPPSGTATTGATAVPVVEAHLVRFDTATTGEVLTSVYPAGPTVGDALIAAPISAPWTDRTTHAAASDFQAFLAEPSGQQILANAGWRTTSARPTHPLAAVDTTTSVTMIPASGPSTDEAIAAGLGQPSSPTTSTTPGMTSSPPTTSPPTTSTPPTTSSASTTPASTTSQSTTTPTTTPTTSTTSTTSAADSGPVLTVIVDASSGMGDKEHGETLLKGVKKALTTVFDASITDRIGLWAYSDAVVYPPSGFPELVSTGPVDHAVPVPTLKSGGADDDTASTTANKKTEPRSKALTDALGELKPNGDRWAYGALMEALQKVPKAAVKGRESRVILIVSGADQTPGTPRRLVLDAVRDAAKTVRVDTIGLGDAVPVDAYSDISKAGGGEYVPAPDVTKLGQQLVDLLTIDTKSTN